MKIVPLLLLNLLTLSAVAQPKASMQSVDILDKSQKLILPAAYRLADSLFTYQSEHIYNDNLMVAPISIHSSAAIRGAKEPNYTFRIITSEPPTGQFRITTTSFEHYASAQKIYYAIYAISCNSLFFINDIDGNPLKRFVIKRQAQPTSFYCCKINDEIKLIAEEEFQQLRNTRSSTLGGFASAQSLAIYLNSCDATGRDRRTQNEKNLDYLKSRVTKEINTICSDIANFMFTKKQFNGFLQGGFKMNVLRKSSTDDYPLIYAKTMSLKTLFSDWALDIDELSTHEKLVIVAAEIEQLAEESADRICKVICYSNASMAYMMAGDLRKAQLAAAQAHQNDKSFFGSIGSTLGRLFEYLQRRDMINTVDEIDYQQFLLNSNLY